MIRRRAIVAVAAFLLAGVALAVAAPVRAYVVPVLTNAEATARRAQRARSCVECHASCARGIVDRGLLDATEGER